MNAIIDLVAQAIKDNIEACLPVGVTVDYDYAARAAVEVLLEPTSAMELAGYRNSDNSIEAVGELAPKPEKQCGLIWTAMVEEILR